MVWGKTINGLRLFTASLALFAAVVRVSANSQTNVFFVSTLNLLPSLAVNSVSNGQIKLSLQAEPGISHFIESSSDLKQWTSVATNSDDATNRTITLPVMADMMFYRVSRNPVPIFTYALAAKTYMNLNGLGGISDSWNSHDTNQSLNGYYNGYAGTNGDLAVGDGIADIGSKTVNGDIYLGPSSLLTMGSDGGITGQIYPDSYLLFPDIALPSKDTNGNAITWKSAPGTASSHSFTNSGYYIVSDSESLSIDPGTTVTLLINTTNYTPNGITIKGGTTNAGTLIIYQPSGVIALNVSYISGAANSRPENFAYYGLSDVSRVSFGGGGSAFVGLVYAPSASCVFNNGGSSLNFMGSCVAKDITVNGHVAFHYDTSLRTNWPCR